jgi:hypothetical protein
MISPSPGTCPLLNYKVYQNATLCNINEWQGYGNKSAMPVPVMTHMRMLENASKNAK